MERLAKKNINTAKEYDRIYFERQKSGISDQDRRRWKKLLKHYKGGSLIDIGCLDSEILPMMRERVGKTLDDGFGAFYLGIDVASKAIEDMRKKWMRPFGNAQFEVADLYATGCLSETYDYAIMGEVIEHLEDPTAAIKETMRILKVGGTLAISTPMNESREPGAVDGDRHLWSFNITDIIEMIKPYGRVKTSSIGSQYFPKYRYHFPTIIAWCKKNG